MKLLNVLVSIKLDKGQKQLFEDELGSVCNLKYLNEAKDRKTTIEEADIIISWNPAKDFSENEFPLMKKTGFMQLFSAGADHVSFKLFPESFIIAGNVGAY